MNYLTLFEGKTLLNEKRLSFDKRAKLDLRFINIYFSASTLPDFDRDPE